MLHLFRTSSILSVGLFFLVRLSATFPVEDEIINDEGTRGMSLKRQDEPGVGRFFLRIMPLGASITAGYGSNPYNGYRKPLRDELRYLEYDVNMVGCQNQYGNMADREHEGHPSLIISDITDLMGCGLSQKPNLVLINAGTNDCIQAVARAKEHNITPAQWIDDGKNRMRTMIDMVFEASPGVTVILSSLLLNANAAINVYVDQINVLFRQLVTEYQSAGKKVALAELNDGFITVSDLNVDGVHPTNEGYPKLAAVWTEVIEDVFNAGWIVTAINTTGSDTNTTCTPSPNNFRGPIQTQRGVGADDGTYSHASENKGVPFEYHGLASSPIYENFHFAQLVNAGGADPPGQADELIRVLDPDQRSPGGIKQPAISAFLNTGGAFAQTYIEIDVGTDCLNRGIHWGDLNGDGLDDFICINTEGKTWASINRGGNPPTFEYIGMIKDSLSWAPQERIRLADIDGDGRLDWCAIDDNGDIYCWRNGGTGDAPIKKYGGYWQSIEVNAPTFNAKGEPGIEGVRFIDINGDGRSDWVYVFEDGSTRIFINQRGTHKDTDIHGLKPAWVEAAVAHRGFPGETIDRGRIKFGRIYATGRADYIRLTDYPGVSTYDYNFEFYKNTGVGGLKLKGDGDHYCDMYGRGHDDYLWVWSTGRIDLYENTGSPPAWTVHENIFNTGRDRKSIHFGDWNGDGRCDILSVDRHTGNVDMWRNTQSGDATPTFEYEGQVVGGSRCKQGWGLGLYDLGLRFADIDGDKRVDYLCMEPDGRTTGYLNKGSGLVNVNQIKKSVGFDRANHRWADVNGDGRADFLWIDKFTGNVSVWLNDGMKPSAGSSFNWPRALNVWMKGVDAGANMHFPKLGNQRRADFLQVTPKDNLAWVYYNECNFGGAGPGPDDGPITDPHLPIPPGGLPSGGTTSLPPNPAWQDLQPDDVIYTSQGNFTIESRLYDYRGCEASGAGRVKLVQQAFVDALKIVGSVGNPYYIVGSPPGDHTPKGKEVYDYWGPSDEWNQLIVSGNYRRAQLTGQQTLIGDYWYGRFFQITCDDPLKRCVNGLRAYEDDPGTPENSGKYPRINLCDAGAQTFWSLNTTDEKIASIKKNESPIENVESMRSKGSVLLHEMFHTTTKSFSGGYDAGISQPKCIDVIPSDTGTEKAYGAARSKWLARRRTQAKRSLVFMNTDNCTLEGYIYCVEMNREDANRSPEEIEKKKQEQLKKQERGEGHWHEELASQGESNIAADKEKVHDHNSHISKLQEETKKKGERGDL